MTLQKNYGRQGAVESEVGPDIRLFLLIGWSIKQ